MWYNIYIRLWKGTKARSLKSKTYKVYDTNGVKMKIEGKIISNKNGFVKIRQSYTGDVYRCKNLTFNSTERMVFPKKSMVAIGLRLML